MQRAIVTLDPSDLARTLRLAALEIKVGDPGAARNVYENLLARTKPEVPGEPLTLPDELKLPVDYVSVLTSGTGRFRLRPMMAGGALPVSASAPATGDAGLRLEAIRALGRLLFPAAPDTPPDEASRAAWLARWQPAADAGVRNEPLQAFYFSGSKAATMGLLAGWMEKGVGDESLVRGAFLAAGLRLADYPTLAKWAWSDPGSGDHTLRSSALLGAIGQFLATGGRPGTNFVSELFPSGAGQSSLLWETAKQFADLHWYAQAAELGHHVLASVRSGRAEYASSVAEWELYVGAVSQARETLREAVEEGGGTTFDVNTSPVLATLREYYLLLPTVERTPFVTGYLRRMTVRGDTVHATLAGVLLHGLEGDEPAAHRALDALLSTRLLVADENGPSPNTRRWAFLLANGLQLEGWNLDAEAVYLWRRALDQATAFDQQFGEGEGMLLEIRRRLLGAEVSVAANPEEARACVEQYLAGSPPTSTAAGVAGELLNNARFDAAIQIDESLCRVEPNDGEHWRTLFAAYEAAGEPDRLERTLARVFQSKGPFPEGLPREDFVCRWAAARERDGDAAGACRLLSDEKSTHPGLLPILVQLAQTYERAGRWSEAAAAWRETSPLDPTAVPILGEANAEEHLGHRERAISLLQDNLRSRAGQRPGRNRHPPEPPAARGGADGRREGPSQRPPARRSARRVAAVGGELRGGGSARLCPPTARRRRAPGARCRAACRPTAVADGPVPGGQRQPRRISASVGPAGNLRARRSGLPRGLGGREVQARPGGGCRHLAGAGFGKPLGPRQGRLSGRRATRHVLPGHAPRRPASPGRR